MSISLMKRLAAVAGVGLLGLSSTAFASPTCPESNDPSADYKCVFINTGVDKYGAGTTTAAFYELGITGTLATSLYSLNNQGVIGLGSQIVDTNRKSVINAAGFVGNSNYNTLANPTGNPSGAPKVNIKDTASFGQRNIDGFNDLDSFDNSQTQGLNSAGGYTLTYDYMLNGSLGATGPSFSSGDFAVYYDDLSTAGDDHIQVLRVNITGSTLNSANLDLLGNISFDFDNNGSNDCTTSFCQNFWNFQAGPQDWYSLANQGVAIAFHLDTNVNPPIPTADQLAIGANGPNGPFARQTTLDSSVRFNVPEPGSLALVGLALVGVAAGSIRRARKG